MRITVAVSLLLAVVLVLPAPSDAWWFWRRRRSSCTRVNCIARSWGSWSSCTGAYGLCYRQRTRSLVRQGSCGGTTCTTVSRQRCTCPGSSISCSYVSRTEWGARKPRARSPLRTPVPYVFIHHTVTPECYTETSCKDRVRAVQRGHMDDAHTRYDDIGYNWLIGGDGQVYEGRGWDIQGAHASRLYNPYSIGISFIGNFVSRRPSARALSAAQALIRCGVQSGKIRTNYELFPHNRAKSTACPGRQLDNIIKTWPNYSNRVIPRYKK